MPPYFAFLRAVNIGGGTVVKMATLRGIFEAIGFTAVSTFIASGNVIFDTRLRNTAVIEDQIEAALMQTLGREFTPFVRSSRDLARIAAFTPFAKSSFAPGDQLGILFLGRPLANPALQALLAIKSPAEELRVEGREIYWLRHRDVGTLYPTTQFDRALDQPYTTRSSGTIAKLAERYVRSLRG